MDIGSGLGLQGHLALESPGKARTWNKRKLSPIKQGKTPQKSKKSRQSSMAGGAAGAHGA